MIEFSHVHKHFTSSKRTIHALDDVSLRISDGQIYGIVGYSGAGKSTLLRMINGLESPDTGQVVVDGFEVSAAKGKALRNLRHSIGMIFQHFNLLESKTVAENIERPLLLQHVPKDQRRAKSLELAQYVGLAERLNERVANLSGGQKQRVGIARALATDPKILLADEATSALDPTTTQQILQLLRRINHDRGITIVLITHHMNVVSSICDRVAVMSDGVVVESGKTDEVFANPSHAITKEFLKVITDDAIPEVIQRRASHDPDVELQRLVFTGSAAHEPILDTVSKNFDVQISVLAATITELKNSTLGSLVISLRGSYDERTRALNYVAQSGVRVAEYDGEFYTPSKEHIYV